MPNQLIWLQQLSTWTNELDKIVNHVLGYLIALSGESVPHSQSEPPCDP
jgi:hypothetical protein